MRDDCKQPSLQPRPNEVPNNYRIFLYIGTRSRPGRHGTLITFSCYPFLSFDKHAKERRTTEIKLAQDLSRQRSPLSTPRLLPQRWLPQAATGRPCRPAHGSLSFCRRALRHDHVHGFQGEEPASIWPALNTAKYSHAVKENLQSDGGSGEAVSATCPGGTKKRMFCHQHGADFYPVIFKTV